MKIKRISSFRYFPLCWIGQQARAVNEFVSVCDCVCFLLAVFSKRSQMHLYHITKEISNCSCLFACFSSYFTCRIGTKQSKCISITTIFVCQDILIIKYNTFIIIKWNVQCMLNFKHKTFLFFIFCAFHLDVYTYFE